MAMATTNGEVKKILIVEDDGELCELLAATLRERRYQPLVLRRGEKVLKTVKDEKPRAVILDLALPDRDGRQVLTELKDDWDAKKVPVITRSGYTSRVDYQARSQVEAVITKPFDLQDLLAKVEAAANKKQD